MSTPMRISFRSAATRGATPTRSSPPWSIVRPIRTWRRPASTRSIISTPPAGWKGACRRSTSTRRSILPPTRTWRRPASIRCGIISSSAIRKAASRSPPTELIGANGFDFVYYLNHNPDVAAAGVDPFQHFQTVGWQEGRNPNALFDTNGYLATYGDVAAAHVNPLDHYNTFGWHEGRDPSPGFDTTDYLAAYADVAAAARQSARAFPPVRHPRGPLALRGRRVGVAIRRSAHQFVQRDVLFGPVVALLRPPAMSAFSPLFRGQADIGRAAARPGRAVGAARSARRAVMTICSSSSVSTRSWWLRLGCLPCSKRVPDATG